MSGAGVQPSFVVTQLIAWNSGPELDTTGSFKRSPAGIRMEQMRSYLLNQKLGRELIQVFSVDVIATQWIKAFNFIFRSTSFYNKHKAARQRSSRLIRYQLCLASYHKIPLCPRIGNWKVVPFFCSRLISDTHNNSSHNFLNSVFMENLEGPSSPQPPTLQFCTIPRIQISQTR